MSGQMPQRSSKNIRHPLNRVLTRRDIKLERHERKCVFLAACAHEGLTT